MTVLTALIWAMDTKPRTWNNNIEKFSRALLKQMMVQNPLSVLCGCGLRSAYRNRRICLCVQWWREPWLQQTRSQTSKTQLEWSQTALGSSWRKTHRNRRRLLAESHQHCASEGGRIHDNWHHIKTCFSTLCSTVLDFLRNLHHTTEGTLYWFMKASCL